MEHRSPEEGGRGDDTLMFIPGDGIVSVIIEEADLLELGKLYGKVLTACCRSQIFSRRTFFRGEILSGHMQILLQGASILHHAGGLHKVSTR